MPESFPRIIRLVDVGGSILSYMYTNWVNVLMRPWSFKKTPFDEAGERMGAKLCLGYKKFRMRTCKDHHMNHSLNS